MAIETCGLWELPTSPTRLGNFSLWHTPIRTVEIEINHSSHSSNSRKSYSTSAHFVRRATYGIIIANRKGEIFLLFTQKAGIAALLWWIGILSVNVLIKNLKSTSKLNCCLKKYFILIVKRYLFAIKTALSTSPTHCLLQIVRSLSKDFISFEIVDDRILLGIIYLDKYRSVRYIVREIRSTELHN